MSEPKTKALRVTPVAPGILWWRVSDDRIGGAESDAYAVREGGEVVLIDPLPVDEGALASLGRVTHIVLTASCHQRSAWRFRRHLGARVLAPEGAVGLEEEPDAVYRPGERLPGGLEAVHSPGPTEAMYALRLAGPPSVLFLSDLLSHDGSGCPGFMESEYQDDPRRTRESVRALLQSHPADILCFAHGPPILSATRSSLEMALANDREFPEARA